MQFFRIITQFKSHFFFDQYLLFYNLFLFSTVEALIGENVKQVHEGDYMFVVALGLIHQQDSSVFRQFCTGILISARDVLSTEHCIIDKDPQTVKISIGHRDFTLGTKYAVAFWIPYNYWAHRYKVKSKSKKNDVAMIRLKESIPGNVIVARLKYEDCDKLSNEKVWVASWGNKDSIEKAKIMETVRLIVRSRKDCISKIFGDKKKISALEPNIFCSTSKPCVSITESDSGGPVISANGIIGIMKGTGLNSEVQVDPKKVNIHVCLGHYLEFIADFVKHVRNKLMIE